MHRRVCVIPTSEAASDPAWAAPISQETRARPAQWVAVCSSGNRSLWAVTKDPGPLEDAGGSDSHQLVLWHLQSPTRACGRSHRPRVSQTLFPYWGRARPMCLPPGRVGQSRAGSQRQDWPWRRGVCLFLPDLGCLIRSAQGLTGPFCLVLNSGNPKAHLFRAGSGIPSLDQTLWGHPGLRGRANGI